LGFAEKRSAQPTNRSANLYRAQATQLTYQSSKEVALDNLS